MLGKRFKNVCGDVRKRMGKMGKMGRMERKSGV